MICRICKNSENNRTFQIKEMMFGLRESFSYFECSNCSCLQISEIPQDMRAYYPSDYISWSAWPAENFVRRFLRIQRDRYELLHLGPLGRLLCRWYPNHVLELIGKAKVATQSKILDVGCGSGTNLFHLRHAGFRNLVGVDPYAGTEVEKEGLRILKMSVHELPHSEKFDLIFLRHSLEHIPDQRETLLSIQKLLAPQGICLIMVPVKTDYIWGLYGTDWVQIDAPRHLFLHTLKSFDCLSREAGLLIRDIVFDSSEFQSWGSEQYKRDIPLKASNSYAIDPKKSIFTRRQIVEFKKTARRLNKIKQGDSAAFYLANSER